MKEDQRVMSNTPAPTLLQAQRAVAEARLLFNRRLANWTSDLLLLRQSGLRHPCWRANDRDRDLHKAA
jgi:hypothetical protein